MLTKVVAAAETNCWAFWKHVADCAGGRVIATDGVEAVHAPTFSRIRRIDPALDARRVLEVGRRIVEGHDFQVVTLASRDKDLERVLQEGGWSSVAQPLMILRLDEPINWPTTWRVRQLSDERAIAGFLDVTLDAWADHHVSPDNWRAVITPTALLHPDIVMVGAYSDAGLVGVSLAFVPNEVVGINWVGTRRSAQRNGVGEACTVAALAAGAERGASTAALLATVVGERLYARVGFETFDGVGFWRGS